MRFRFFSGITPNDKKIINMQDDHTLAIWYSDLNTWKWPVELPNQESPFNKNGDYSVSKRRDQIIKYIQNRVGHKYVSQIWNTEYREDPMTMERFNTWWGNNRL